MKPREEVPLFICPDQGDCAGLDCYHHQPHAHIEDCERKCRPICWCTLDRCVPYERTDTDTVLFLKPQREV
jgi:hypothetical protein